MLQVQWATNQPAGFRELPSVAHWASAPKRERPSPGNQVDSREGFVNELVISGVRMTGDVYAVENHPSDPDGCLATVINDDPTSGWTESTRYARVVDIRPPAPDARHGGAFNTRLHQTVYSDDPVFQELPNTTVLPWAAFAYPAEERRKYGAQLPDQLYRRHTNLQAPKSWRSFTAGVPQEFIHPGTREILPGRASGRYDRPKGTRTFYQSATAQANNVHAAANELLLTDTPQGSTTLGSGNIGGNGDSVFSFITVAAPQDADWPEGVYRAVLDVPAANVDTVFGLRNLGNATGHFARAGTVLLIDSDLQTWQQVEPAFALSGLFQATTGTINPLAGSVNNWWELLIAGQRVSGHGNGSFDLRVGTVDSYADGPWTAVTGASVDALFMGAGV